MTGIRRWNDPGLPAPASPFHHAVEAGEDLFLSGVLAADLPGGETLIGDVRREAEAVMAAIREVLDRAGLGLDRLVRVDVHLVDLDDMPAFDAVYAGFFPDGRTPARTCVAVRRLYGDCRVEVTAQAKR